MKELVCPVCDKRVTASDPQAWPQFPFCSPRCKMIDLGRWLGERYGIPKESPEEADEDTGRDEKDAP